MLTIYAVVTSDAHGVGSAATLVTFVVGLALLVAFVVLEHRVAHPVLPPPIMRERTLMVTCVVRALMVVGMFTTVYLCSLYLERLRGFDPIQTGLAFLPQTVIVRDLRDGADAPSRRALRADLGHVRGMALLVIGQLILMAAPPTRRLLIPFALIGVGGGMSS